MHSLSLARCAAALGALLFTVATTSAQTEHFLPRIQNHFLWAGNDGSDTGIGAPAGTESRVQYLYRQGLVGVTTVTNLAFRRTANSTDYAAFTANIQIDLASATNPSLLPTFANNVGAGRATVLTSQTVNIQAQPADIAPHDWIVFPLTQPWTPTMTVGASLIVEVWSSGSTNAAPALRLDRCLTDPNGESLTFGTNCGAATISASSPGGGNFRPGSWVHFHLTNATPHLPTLFVAGGNAVDSNGFPLPVDLGIIGFPGCRLHVEPAVHYLLFADPTGSATIPAYVPTSVGGISLAAQWLAATAFDPNSGVLTASVTPGLLVNIGPRTWPELQQLSAASLAATTGTLTDEGPVIRLISNP